MTRRPFAAPALTLALLLAGGAAPALETDQFAAWRKPLADAAPAINAKINLEIQRALDEVNRRGGEPDCVKVGRAIRRRLHFQILHPIELWALQSPFVDYFPPRGDAEARFLEASIYRHSPVWDIAMWMPLSPTIEVGGIRCGTDKLAHFVSSGWRYRNAYLRRLRRGDSPEQAELAAIRWGIVEERSITGTLASGVFSRSDLEANYAGMRFYLDLCGGADPILERVGGKWRQRRPYDIRTAVTPEWDESYLLPIYNEGRWREVRPEIAAACGELADPVVTSRVAAYRARDTVTQTERVLAEMVSEGKLRDPARYSLAAICPHAVRPPPGGTPPPAATARPATPFPPGLPEALAAADRDRSRRVFTLWRGAVGPPLTAAASAGVIVTRLPRTHDCRTLCEMRGLTLQASAGLAGGELAVGWARIFGETGPRRRVLADVPLAYGIRGALLRTWGDSPLDPSIRSLAGVEVAFTITRVSFTAGAFVPISGDHHRRVLAGSIGFGF